MINERSVEQENTIFTHCEVN